ncbi:MAG: MFS transporter [Bacilli bacterium]|jgi:fucose permease|nr:MFS transporter [Bacilli bacterium]
MTFALLLIIYLIFISLGLPDSMLGSTFPAIADNLSISPDMSGYIGLVVSGGTIISSLFSDKLIAKFKTKWVVSVSILLTAAGLLAFSFVPAGMTWLFFVVAIPLGLGAGAIDSALNNYVALHYKAIHMNWLHCSWGVGASIGPLIIGSFIDSSNHSAGWEKGVLTISLIQFGIAAVAFATLPLWNKVANKNTLDKKKEEKKDKPTKPVSRRELFKNPIFYLAMIGFFSYCALETTTGSWSGFFFNRARGFSTQESANLTAMFYLGITIGRFICGPISLKLKEKTMIRIGEGVLLVGVILALIPVNNWFGIIGFAGIGLGCAPIYPAIIRSTPYRFSREMSQHAMGLEMAIAYCGSTFISPLYGLTARSLDNFSLLPYVDGVILVIMITCHEIINVKLSRRDKFLSEEEKKAYQTL